MGPPSFGLEKYVATNKDEEEDQSTELVSQIGYKTKKTNQNNLDEDESGGMNWNHIRRERTCSSFSDLLSSCSPVSKATTCSFLQHPLRSDALNCLAQNMTWSSLDSWSFDVFLMERITFGHPCLHIGLQLFRKHEDILRKLPLDPLQLYHTLVSLETCYHRSNPYHNATHAADVAQAMHCFLTEPKLSPHLTPLDKLGALLAALCHDAEHPGVNQAHLTHAAHPLAALYQQHSVLENHHLRVGVAVLRETRLLQKLTVEQMNYVHTIMRELILITDLAVHKTFADKFQNAIEESNNGRFDLNVAENRILVMQMCLKCADVCNAARETPQAREWASRVVDEFFQQGDRERRLYSEIVSSPLFDRRHTDVANVQICFITGIVQPLLNQWHQFMGSKLSQRMCDLAKVNLELWRNYVNQHMPALGCPEATGMGELEWQNENPDCWWWWSWPLGSHRNEHRRLSLPPSPPGQDWLRFKPRRRNSFKEAKNLKSSSMSSSVYFSTNVSQFASSQYLSVTTDDTKEDGNGEKENLLEDEQEEEWMPMNCRPRGASLADILEAAAVCFFSSSTNKCTTAWNTRRRSAPQSSLMASIAYFRYVAQAETCRSRDLSQSTRFATEDEPPLRCQNPQLDSPNSSVLHADLSY